jgi:hypothetical protein
MSMTWESTKADATILYMLLDAYTANSKCGPAFCGGEGAEHVSDNLKDFVANIIKKLRQKRKFLQEPTRYDDYEEGE